MGNSDHSNPRTAKPAISLTAAAPLWHAFVRDVTREDAGRRLPDAAARRRQRDDRRVVRRAARPVDPGHGEGAVHRRDPARRQARDRPRRACSTTGPAAAGASTRSRPSWARPRGTPTSRAGWPGPGAGRASPAGSTRGRPTSGTSTRGAARSTGRAPSRSPSPSRPAPPSGPPGHGGGPPGGGGGGGGGGWRRRRSRPDSEAQAVILDDRSRALDRARGGSGDRRRARRRRARVRLGGAVHVLVLCSSRSSWRRASSRSSPGSGPGSTSGAAPSILLVYGVFLATVVGLAFVVVPVAIRQARARRSPRCRRSSSDVRSWATTIEPAGRRPGRDLGRRRGRPVAPPAGRRAAGRRDRRRRGHDRRARSSSVLTLLTVVYFWLTEHARLQRYALAFVPHPPPGERPRRLEPGGDAPRAWVQGELILMATIGVATGVAYTLLGVPAALLLGLIAALARRSRSSGRCSARSRPSSWRRPCRPSWPSPSAASTSSCS